VIPGKLVERRLHAARCEPFFGIEVRLCVDGPHVRWRSHSFSRRNGSVDGRRCAIDRHRGNLVTGDNVGALDRLAASDFVEHTPAARTRTRTSPAMQRARENVAQSRFTRSSVVHRRHDIGDPCEVPTLSRRLSRARVPRLTPRTSRQFRHRSPMLGPIRAPATRASAVPVRSRCSAVADPGSRRTSAVSDRRSHHEVEVVAADPSLDGFSGPRWMELGEVEAMVGDVDQVIRASGGGPPTSRPRRTSQSGG